MSTVPCCSLFDDEMPWDHKPGMINQQFLLDAAERYCTILRVIRPMLMNVVCVKDTLKEIPEEREKETPRVRSLQYMDTDRRDHTMRRNTVQRYLLDRNISY